jgi:hypothetical protein
MIATSDDFLKFKVLTSSMAVCLGAVVLIAIWVTRIHKIIQWFKKTKNLSSSNNEVN